MFVVSMLRGIDVEGIPTGLSKNAASANPAESPANNAQKLQSPDSAASVGQEWPDEIKKILNKVSAGQVLSDPDRKILNDWMTKSQISNGRLQPFGSGVQKPKSKRVPVPAPGEV